MPNNFLQDLATNAWTGSVLVVSFGPQPPLLTLSHTGHQFHPQPTCLDTFQNFSFWRWQLDLQLMPQESVVEYTWVPSRHDVVWMHVHTGKGRRFTLKCMGTVFLEKVPKWAQEVCHMIKVSLALCRDGGKEGTTM